MGLFDALQFDPSTYGGQGGGGILDFLKRYGQMPDASVGMPSAGMMPGQAPQQAQRPAPMNLTPDGTMPIGGYQMPMFGASPQQAAAPSPTNNAMLPPNAQPTQGQLPQLAAQAQSPTLPAFLQNPSPGFGAALSNFAAGPGLISKLSGAMQGFTTGMPTGAQGTQIQNQRAQYSALLQAGMDPNKAMLSILNPEVGKTLLDQQFGPHNITSLGSGYIYDPKSGKITRAFTPDENTPSSVREYQFYKSQLPQGQTPIDFATFKAGNNPNGVSVLGRGGEIYKVGTDGQPVILHKNTEGSGDATLGDETVQSMADQYLAGDRTVLQNLGRGAQGAANVVKLREAIHSRALGAGIDPKGIVQNFNEQAGALAGQRAVGTRAANISLAANEANNMIPIALAASDKLPRTQYMPWNQMVQAVQKGTSSPELASFVAATNSLVNSYVRAVSPSGVPTDSMREHAYSMLNAAQGPAAYKAVIATMKQEMQAALQAPSQVKKELRGESGEGSAKQTVIDGYTITEH